MIKQPTSNTIVFCVDANAKIGVGHAMRCLALMEALANYPALKLILLTASMPQYLVEKAQKLGVFIEKHDEEKRAQAIIDCYHQQNATLLIVDGYHIPDHAMQHFQRANLQVALFDDVNDRKVLCANIIINACPDAEQLGYLFDCDKQYLLGLSYAMLNPSLQHISPVPYQQRQALTLCFGGSDVAGLTKKFVGELSVLIKELSLSQVQVITGKLVEGLDDIAKWCKNAGFTHYIQPDNLGELLSRTRLAIAAPGNLVYELAYFNVPSILLTVADNQKLSAQFHQKVGWATVFDGRSEDVLPKVMENLKDVLANPIQLNDMSNKSHGLIDGQGAKRLAAKLCEVANVY